MSRSLSLVVCLTLFAACVTTGPVAPLDARAHSQRTWAAATDARWVERAPRLQRWQRAFAGRPPILDGAEIARALALPEGPDRTAAVRALRSAQARGEVRSPSGALRFLQRWLALRRVDSLSYRC